MTNNSKLSALEQTILITFELLVGEIERVLLKDISKDEKKCLRMIKTYQIKYGQAVGNRIDYESQKKLKSKYKNFELALEPKQVGKNFRVNLLYSDYLYLVEEILEHNCKGCRGIGCDGIRDKNRCRIHQILMDTYVPELNLPSENMPCEYVYGTVSKQRKYTFHISTKKWSELYKESTKNDGEYILVYFENGNYILSDADGNQIDKKKIPNFMYTVIQDCIMYTLSRARCLPKYVIKAEVEEMDWDEKDLVVKTKKKKKKR